MTGKSPLATVRAAPAATLAAKSSRFASTLVLSDTHRTRRRATVTARGEYDFARQRGQFTITAPRSSRFRALEPLLEGSVIVDGSVRYQRLDSQLAVATGHRPWLKIDLSPQPHSGDPTEPLAYLHAAIAISVVGRDVIRGARVTHYRGTVDVARAPDDDRETLATSSQLIREPRFPVDAWIDGHGRAHKLEFHFDGTQRATRHAAVPITVDVKALTLEFFDFGIPVTAEPPPAEQVAAASSG